MIERFLSSISINNEASAELRGRIRRELRTLKLLTLAIMIALGLIVLFSLASCSNTPKPDEPTPIAEPINPLVMEIPDLNTPPMIRVLVREPERVEKIHLLATGDFEIKSERGRYANTTGGQVTITKEKGKLLARIQVAQKSALLIEGRTFTITNRAQSPLTTSISINGQDFEGNFELKLDGGKFALINLVDLEAYTRGSVGWEAIPSWQVEALKAQAVAIRTYTLFTIYHNQAVKKKRAWDVDNTTRFLRYGGLGPTGQAHQRKASANVVRAIEESRQEVMLFEGKIFKAFFASNSGGYSASVKTSFGLNAIAPLAGVDLGDFGKRSSLYRWERQHSAVSIEQKLAKSGKTIGAILAIQSETNDPSGFTQRVKITGANKTITISAAEFRRLIGTGPKGLPSTNFKAEKALGDFIFKGRGWGHGVGMDQWAAQGMAKAGLGYREILRRHYPKTTVTRPWLQ